MKHALTTLLLTALVSLTAAAQEVLWKGTLHLKNGTKMEKCQILDVVGTKLKVNQLGTTYGIPISDLAPSTKGELGIGTAEDVQAYQARRKAEVQAEQAKIDAELRQIEINRRLRDMQAAAKAKREAEMERMRQQAQREREIQALEAIARGLNR